MKFPGPEEEAAFFDGLNQGDQKCFVQVFNEYCQPLQYYSKQILGDSDEAQDIVAQVFIKLYDGLKNKLSFEKVQLLKAFLYVTTRNQCLSHLRNIKRINSGNTELRVLTDPFDPAIDEQLIKSELYAEIYKEIKNLPDRQGEIFMLANYAGLSNAEIARLLNISVSTVKTANQKATQKLKAVFAKKPIFLLLLFGICSN